LKLQKTIEEHEIWSSIHLDGQQLTDKDMEIILNDVIVGQQCKQISLSENKITSIGAFIIADALNTNTTLKALSIDNNHLGDIGLYSLAKTLTINNRTLSELNLGSNGITDEGIKHLVHMLRTNKTLTELHLSENDITDAGVKILTDVIQNGNTTIEKLWLSRNKLLTDSSVSYFIPMIKQSSSLKKLFIVDCSLSDKSKNQLKKVQQSKQNFDLSV